MVMAKIVVMALIVMAKSHKPEQQYENQLAQIFRDSGWEVIPRPHAPSQEDLIIKKDDLEYAVELKRAPESRRDRVVPLLAEAILHAQLRSQDPFSSPPQNPPTFGSWGFDSPSRHQPKSLQNKRLAGASSPHEMHLCSRRSRPDTHTNECNIYLTEKVKFTDKML